MENTFYGGMLNGLSRVNLSGFERAQAELHLRRAAALVEMLLGSREVVKTETVEAPVAAPQAEELRKAA